MDERLEVLTKEIHELRNKEEDLTKALAGREAKEAELKETIDKIQKRLDELEVNRKRLNLDLKNEKAIEFKKALNQYIKTGKWPAELEVKVLQEGTGASGGYLVAPEYAQEIIAGIREISPMRQLVRVMATNTNRVYWPIKSGTTSAAFVTETGTRSERTWSTPLGQKAIDIYEAYHRVDVTNWLIEDAFADAEAFVREEIVEAFAALEGNKILLGTGSSEPYGITVELDTNNVVQLASVGTVTADEIKTAYFKIKSVYAKNGTWLFNRNTMLVFSLLKDDYGRYLLQQLAEGPEWVLMGAPVVEAPDLSNIGNNTDIFALFGDYKRAYILMERLDMTLLRDPFSSANTGSIVIHARKRWGGRMVLPEAVAALKNKSST